MDLQLQGKRALLLAAAREIVPSQTPDFSFLLLNQTLLLQKVGDRLYHSGELFFSRFFVHGFFNRLA